MFALKLEKEGILVEENIARVWKIENSLPFWHIAHKGDVIVVISFAAISSPLSVITHRIENTSPKYRTPLRTMHIGIATQYTQCPSKYNSKMLERDNKQGRK